MDCCGIMHYWCCLQDAKPSEPWYDRNRGYGILAGILGAIGLLVVSGLIGISPIFYGFGLLTQKIDGSNDKGYWINIAMGWLGFMMLFWSIVAVIFAIFTIWFFGYKIYEYCSRLNSEYKEIKTNESNGYVLQDAYV